MDPETYVNKARYAAILEAALDCIVSMDHRGRILDFNRAAEQTFGFRREQVLGQPMAELLIPPAMRQRHHDGIARYLATGEGPIIGKRIEMPALRSDGTEFPCELTVTRVPMDGPPVFTAHLRDITQHKQAEEAQREHDRERTRLLAAEQAARRDAEEANRAKDLFLATLSHELRTPLSAIVGWAAVLEQGGVSEQDLNTGIEAIGRNARAQAKLIDDVLDISRVVSGKLELELQRCEPAEIIRAALEVVRPSAAAKQIEIETRLDGSSCILCDPVRLQQVLWNLLTNAFKFTPKGGRVQVALSRESSGVRIEVSDNGRGIARDFLPHVFERFRQADSSTRRGAGGMGLGLAIVKHIVELHGGTVEAESEGPGQGARFIVRLPTKAVGPEKAESAASETSPPADGARLRLQGVRVLVVDDEPDARVLITRVLEARGAVVTAISSVEEAMRALPAAGFDVLVSDLAMPGTDGFDLIKRVREGGYSPQSLPAVALTAFADKEIGRSTLAAGFQAHLTKPVEPDQLIAVIASLTLRAFRSPS